MALSIDDVTSTYERLKKERDLAQDGWESAIEELRRLNRRLQLLKGSYRELELEIAGLRNTLNNITQVLARHNVGERETPPS